MGKGRATSWGDLRIDQEAWELAKTAVGEDSTISEIAIHAQAIKETLKAGELRK
jgi:hypothetical protein